MYGVSFDLDIEKHGLFTKSFVSVLYWAWPNVSSGPIDQVVDSLDLILPRQM
jgi:hypothetical protein